MIAAQYNHVAWRGACMAAFLAMALTGAAGASVVEPFILADHRGEASDMAVSRLYGHLMIQGADVSLMDIASTPELLLSNVRFEGVGDSGLAGLMLILLQDSQTEMLAVPAATVALANQWVSQDDATYVADDVYDVEVRERRMNVAAGDNRLAARSLGGERPGRRQMATGRPSSAPPGRVGQPPVWTGAVRAGSAAAVSQPQTVAAMAATSAPMETVQSPQEGQNEGVNAILFVAASGNLAAEARFWQEGNLLKIQLTNTSMADPAAVTEVLTALFFNIAGQPTLTPVSVVMASGSTILYPITQPSDGKTVSGEWAYRKGDVKTPGSMEYGLSVTGYNSIFKQTDRFPGASLHGNGNNTSDASFGLVGPGKTNTGNKTMTGNLPFIQNSVIFTLSGLPDTFDLLTDIDRVWFQYGTSLGDPSIESLRIIQEWEEELINPPEVPEPAALSLLAMGSLILLRRRR